MTTRNYKVFKDTIVEALDHLDSFQSKMDNFVKIHPSYTYKTNVKEVNGVWEVDIIVNKHEHTNTKTT